MMKYFDKIYFSLISCGFIIKKFITFIYSELTNKIKCNIICNCKIFVNIKRVKVNITIYLINFL